MNDYQEYRSYGSYLGRVFAIIFAFIILVAAIWAVYRFALQDNATLGDTSTPSQSEVAANGEETEADEEEDADIFISGNADDESEVAGETSDDNGEDAVAVGSDTESDSAADEEGQTLSTNTDREAAANAANGVSNVAGANTDAQANDDDLPNTGANPMTVLLVGAIAFFGSKLALPKES